MIATSSQFDLDSAVRELSGISFFSKILVAFVAMPCDGVDIFCWNSHYHHCGERGYFT